MIAKDSRQPVARSSADTPVALEFEGAMHPESSQ